MFHFLRQMNWFLGNDRVSSKFRYHILHYVISAIKLIENWSIRHDFILTTHAILHPEDHKDLPFGMISF